MASSAALEVVGRDVLVDGGLHDVNHPRGRVVAEIGHGDGRRGVDWCEEPKEDDGEEAEDWEEDEHAPGVHDGADEQQQAEESEESCKNENINTWFERRIYFLKGYKIHVLVISHRYLLSRFWLTLNC